MYKRVEDNQVMLAVTSLIHAYCKNTPGCENNEDVMNITTFFEEIVRDTCEKMTNINRVCICLYLCVYIHDFLFGFYYT